MRFAAIFARRLSLPCSKLFALLYANNLHFCFACSNLKSSKPNIPAWEGTPASTSLHPFDDLSPAASHAVCRPDRHPRFCYRLAAVLLLAHLLAIIALAASPRLHHWVHPDADDDDHDCAVVLFIHGGCGQAPAPMIIPACVSTWHVPTRVELSPIWVAGIFVVNGTLEHAPPLAGRASNSRHSVVVT